MKRVRTGEYKVFQFRQTDRHPKIVLWILRILVQLGVLRKFVEKEGLENMNLARYLGIDDLQEYSGAFDAPAVRQKIVALQKRLESRKTGGISTTFSGNLGRLSALLGLSEVDERVLEFAVALDAVPALSHATSYLGATSLAEIIRCLEIILKIDQSALKRSLHPGSILAKSGLVTYDRNSVPMEHSLDLLSEGFAERMMTEELEPIELIRDVVYRTSAPSLTLSDYAHIQDALDILCPYLRNAVANRRAGVNVYLYGPPGTGKTELAKVLAQAVACELYEVTCEDNDSDIASSGERMKAFSAAQNFFARRQAMILFDEVESVFERNHFLGPVNATLERKAWLNRILETNPIPAIWISNSVDIDGAFLRRFDAVFEIPVPPKVQRRQIIRKTCDGLLGEDAVRRIAEPELLAPALVARSSAVIRTISNEIGSDRVSGAIETLINSRLRARGDRPLKKEDVNSTSRYEPNFVNADIDPEALAESLRVAKEGRLCFHGPSGTGKTAFARWLVSQCELPLIVKQGSDLVSPYVGQTERNIARAFGEASETNSALLIDEFDGLLQDRRHAWRNWEIAQVNEMLVQVDEYRGVFITTTNRLDAMDPAILRRFDMKVEFGCLTPQQVEVLFKEHCQLLGLDRLSSAILNDLRQLTNVTIGDFAVISRQSRLNRILSSEIFLSRLRKECSFREVGKRPIGFLN